MPLLVPGLYDAPASPSQQPPARRRARQRKQRDGKRIPGGNEERRIIGAVRGIEARRDAAGGQPRQGAGESSAASARRAASPTSESPSGPSPIKRDGNSGRSAMLVPIQRAPQSAFGTEENSTSTARIARSGEIASSSKAGRIDAPGRAAASTRHSRGGRERQGDYELEQEARCLRPPPQCPAGDPAGRKTQGAATRAARA